MKNIVYITENLDFFSDSGAKIKTLNTIECLSKKFHITILSLNSSKKINQVYRRKFKNIDFHYVVDKNIENPIKFSLGFGIRSAIETSSGLRGEGRLAWGGAACSYFFIDPSQNVTAVFATQLFPFNSQLNDEFHYIVLESLAQEDVNAGPQK